MALFAARMPGWGNSIARGTFDTARRLLSMTCMDAVDSIANTVRRYLARRPATILELVEHVDDPWLRPESRADVLAAVENLCAEGLLEEHRNTEGCPFYRLAGDPTANAPASSDGAGL